MSPELCAESFKRAKDFFSKWMPEKKHAAIACHSWIFSPNLTEILPESSNLVKLQKMVNLFPVHSAHDGGLWFIFLQRPFNLATAPRETSLQKAVIAYLEKGGRFRAGGMFVLLSDFLTRSFNCSGDVEKGVVAKKDYRREI